MNIGCVGQFDISLVLASLCQVVMMLTETLACFVVVIIVLYGFVKYFTQSKKNVIPFIPYRLPIIGNAWNIDLSKPHLSLEKWAQKFGPVFRIQLYRENVLVLSDYSSIYEALVVNGPAFSGRPPMYRTAQNERNNQSIVWQTYTPKLVFLRKEVHKSLKMFGNGLEQLEWKCKSEIHKLVNKLKHVQNKPVDPHSAIYDSVCNIMINLLLGTSQHHDQLLERIKHLNTNFNETFGSGKSRLLDVLPLIRYFGNRDQCQLMNALKLRDDIWIKHIQPLLKHSKGNQSSILHNLQEYLENPEKSSFDITDNTLKEVFTNLVLAGTDTTTTALTCLLLVFLHHPSIQDKMFHEISSVIGTGGEPSLSQRSSLPYCEAVLLELLRYISHVPLAVPHYTMQDTTICGKHVPANLTVYMNLWALHHDESIWESPWSFNPYRFLDGEGRLLPPGSDIRRRLLVFGAGRRVCLGETLAKNRLFLFAISMVQKLEFLPVNKDMLPSCDPRTYEMGLVLHPKPFKLHIKYRDEFIS